MHRLKELKEMLCNELKEYGGRGKMDAQTLEVVDKLAHTVKNLDKIIEAYEAEEGGASMARGGYSRRGSYANESYGNGSYAGQNIMAGGSYENSYASGRGRNANRDSMGRYASEGRYSNDGGMLADELRGLMNDAPNAQIREEMASLAKKLERL